MDDYLVNEERLEDWRDDDDDYGCEYCNDHECLGECTEDYYDEYYGEWYDNQCEWYDNQ